MKKKLIFRDADNLKDRKHPYVVVCKNIITDERLSGGEIAIMTVLLSNRNDWNQNVELLRIKLKIGKKKFDNHLKKLKELGYVERVKSRAKDGTWKWKTVVREIPKPQSQNPLNGLPQDEPPQLDEPLNDEGIDKIKTIIYKEEERKNVLTSNKKLDKEEELKGTGSKAISDRNTNNHRGNFDTADYIDDLPF